jgi:hypothetical protein
VNSKNDKKKKMPCGHCCDPSHTNVHFFGLKYSQKKEGKGEEGIQAHKQKRCRSFFFSFLQRVSKIFMTAAVPWDVLMDNCRRFAELLKVDAKDKNHFCEIGLYPHRAVSYWKLVAHGN